MTPRFALRAATNELHSKLDESLSRLDLGEVDGYRRFLRFHGRTVPPIEDALAGGGIGSLLPEWDRSRRTPSIVADLSALDEPMPAPVDQPSPRSVAELLGMAYVLEGSRLGGRILRNRVGKDLPISFLAQSGTMTVWPALIAVLDRHLDSELMITEAATAARSCFSSFLSATAKEGIA